MSADILKDIKAATSGRGGPAGKFPVPTTTTTKSTPTPPPSTTTKSTPTTTPMTKSTPTRPTIKPTLTPASSTSASTKLRPTTRGLRSPDKKEIPAKELDEAQLESRFKELDSKTRDKTQAKRIGRNKDTISTLLESLNSKPKFTKMVEYSVECLKNLAVDEASVEEMIEEGVLETLTKIMKLNPYNEKIQRMINKTLEVFAMNDKLAAMIAQRLGPGAFVFSLKKHTEPETLSSTTAVVGKLLKYQTKEVTEAFVKGGAITALYGVIQTGSKQQAVLAGGIDCLDKIALGDPSYASAIFESGVMENVLQAMSEHPEDPKLVESSISLIATLAKTNPKYLEALKKMGAVDILVAALELHPDNEKILELGATALSALAGADDIGSALSVTVGNNLATAKAISKVSSLMLVADNVDFMAKHEGVGWLIAALKGAVGQEGEVARNILLSGTRALMRMAADENKIYGILQQGGVKLLISILSSHADDEEVANSALQALSKMVTRRENAVFILKSGGVEAAMAMMGKHPESEKLAKTTLDFYQKLAAHPDCVGSMVEKGVIQQTVAILSRMGQNPEIAMAAVNTLGRMATTAENMQKIASAGGLEALVAVLNEHHGNLEAAKQAMLMIESAAMIPINVEPLRKAGAMDAILKAIEAHPDDQELQEIGSRTLAMVAGKDQLKAAVNHVQELSYRMTQNPTFALQQADKLNAAVKLLGNLALVENNIDYLVKNGAVDSLISAFRAGTNLPKSDKRAKLLASAAQGLSRLAANAEASHAIVQQGALKDILKAALADPDNEELAEYAAKLAAVCAADPENVDKMIADGTIEDIIALAKAHPLNEKVLAAATKALGLLAKDEGAIKQIIAAGGSEVVVESIFANMDNPEALLNALQVLSQLAIDEDAIGALVAAGAVDAILEAMRKHPDNPEILKACISALCSLMISEEIANSVGEKGGIPLMIKAMRDHYGDEALCEVDMVLCDSLASVKTNAEKFLAEDLGTVELAKWIANKYGENQVIEEAAAKLLATLLGPTEEKMTGEHVVKGVEPVLLNESRVDALLDEMRDAEPYAKQSMLSDLTRMLQDPHNAKLMVQKGGLQALAAMMKENKDDENIFYPASSAFLTLAENGGDAAAAMLEDPACIEAMCMMMKASENFATPMSLSDLTRAIGYCAKMKLKPAQVKSMLTINPLASLIKIMAQSDDPMLLAQAAKLIGKLSNHEEANQMLSSLANIRELINAMRRNIKNEEFLQYGIFLLGNLAQNDELKALIGIEGGITLITNVMELYPHNKGLIENCCFALANLSFGNPVNCSFIVACRGIPAIITTMANNNKAEDLLESAVCVLCNLCHGNDTNKDEITKAGGAQAIVDTILNNFDALDLLITSFRTLGNLAYNKQNISTIIKSGGVQGIVAGMTVHNDQLDIIDIAIRVLTNLAADPDDENMAIMAQEGAVQAVVEAAASYAKHPDLEAAALGCLVNLARVKNNASTIIKQGGCEAVVDAFEQNNYEPKLTEKGARLCHVLTSSQADIDRMLEAKVTDALVGALKAHPKNRVVLVASLNAIAAVAFGEKAAEKMAEAGPIPAILKVIKDNMNDPAVLADAFKALSSLARSEPNAQNMVDQTFKLLVQAFTTHPTNTKMIESAFKWLGNICVHKSIGVLVPTAEIIPTCLKAMATHKTDPNVLIRGCKALENIAFGPAPVKEYLKREGVIPAMKKIQSDNPTKDDVKRAAEQVIEAVLKVDMDINLNFTDLRPNLDKKKDAKLIFGKDEKAAVKVLSREIRNMLTAGSLLIKHSKTANPRPRHVFVDQDLKYVIWKDPKKPVEADNKMKVFMIKQVEKGRCTPQLLRKKALGSYYAKEECSFAIIGRERSVDLEANSEAERDKWVHAIETLVEFRRHQKQLNQNFGSR